MLPTATTDCVLNVTLPSTVRLKKTIWCGNGEFQFRCSTGVYFKFGICWQEKMSNLKLTLLTLRLSTAYCTSFFNLSVRTYGDYLLSESPSYLLFPETNNYDRCVLWKLLVLIGKSAGLIDGALTWPDAKNMSISIHSRVEQLILIVYRRFAQKRWIRVHSV